MFNQRTTHRKAGTRKVRSLPTRPCLELLEARIVPAVTLQSHYDGLNVGNSGGGVPPDTVGAAAQLA